MKHRINNIELNVFETSAGDKNQQRPTLIFLHYFGGSSVSWTEVIEQLSTDYRCIAPDMRGFGASEAPAGNYAVSDYAADAAELIRTFEIETFALVGHSMGGKIALALAAENPPGLQSLILLAPSPPTPEPMDEQTRAEMLATHGSRQAAEKTVRQAAGSELTSEIFERAISDNLRTSEAAWQAWLEAGSREDISAIVGRISAPVLVAAGEKDKNMTPELLNREIGQRVANVTQVVIPAVGHLLPLEAAAAVAQLIREHCEPAS